MKKQLAMVIDSSKCIDCKGCVTACKVQNKVPRGFSRNWIKVAEPNFSDPDWMKKPTSSHFQPGGCMHCETPTCVEACPTGATYKDNQDGAIKVNEELCIGCSSCVSACPYQARYRHPLKKVVDKCDYCESRRAEGSLLACVDTCPTKARVFGDIKNPASEAGRLFRENKTVQVVNAKVNTKPHMYYVDKTAPLNWPTEASSPLPITLWEKAAKPVVWAAMGVNTLAVLAMLGRQLIDRKEKVANQDSLKAEKGHE